MSQERLLEYLSSSSRVLHENKDLRQWFEDDQRREPSNNDIEEVLQSLVSEERLKCRSVIVDKETHKVYWLNRTADVSQTPPHRTPKSANASTPASGQRRKRPLSKFTSPLLVSKRLKTTESMPVSTARGDGGGESSEELDRLMAEKKDLLVRLHDSEEKLRKLKLVRTHHSKNNLVELERLISKWREVSQDVAEQLLPKISNSSAGAPTMVKLLDHLHIDYDTIRYSPEDESFY